MNGPENNDNTSSISRIRRATRSLEQRMPCAANESMDAETPIDLTFRRKDAMDLPGQFAIFSLVSTWFPLVPVIVATHTHLQHAAHRILLTMLSNEGRTKAAGCAKRGRAIF